MASNQLARGGGWDAQSHSTQAVVAALNQASAVMLRRGDLASADLLLRRAHALLPPAGTSAGDTTGCTEGETDGEGNAGLQRQLAVALNNSGCLHRRAGRYDEALNCLEQALAINKALQARARAARASGGGHIGGNASAVLIFAKRCKMMASFCIGCTKATKSSRVWYIAMVRYGVLR